MAERVLFMPLQCYDRLAYGEPNEVGLIVYVQLIHSRQAMGVKVMLPVCVINCPNEALVYYFLVYYRQKNTGAWIKIGESEDRLENFPVRGYVQLRKRAT